jgi:hypothetical protein
MYGSWMGVTLSGLLIVLLLIAAALTAWTPLFALVIFGVIAMIMLVVAAMRRTAETASPGEHDHRGDPVSYAAPADGEGAGANRADSAQEPPAPRLENEPAGIWGEKR